MQWNLEVKWVTYNIYSSLEMNRQVCVHDNVIGLAEFFLESGKQAMGMQCSLEMRLCMCLLFVSLTIMEVVLQLIPFGLCVCLSSSCTSACSLIHPPKSRNLWILGWNTAKNIWKCHFMLPESIRRKLFRQLMLLRVEH